MATLQHTDWLRHERALHPHRVQPGTSSRLAPAAGWSVSLLVSLGLWWGIWSAASSLISALW
jgi:hypothetical protein